MNIFNEDGLIDSDIQDILYELGNVGIGSASVMLGDLLGLRLNIGVPNIMPITETFQPGDIDTRKKTGILMDFYKTLTGSMLFIIDEEFMNNIVKKIGKMEEGFLGESDRTVIMQEFGNLISAAYLKAIGKYSGIRIFVKPIWLQAGLEETLLQEAMERLVGSCHRAICVDTWLSVVSDEDGVRRNVGRVVMLPDEDSVEKMSQALY